MKELNLDQQLNIYAAGRYRPSLGLLFASFGCGAAIAAAVSTAGGTAVFAVVACAAAGSALEDEIRRLN